MSDLLFRNNNGSAVKKLAARSLKADRRRNTLVIVTIAFAAALLALICFYSTAQHAKLLDDIRGQYQAGCAGVSDEQIERLSKSPEIEQWGVSRMVGSTRYEDAVMSVLYEDANQLKLARRPEPQGRLPETADEIMVEASFLRYKNLPLKTGQTLTMDLGDGVTRGYTVSGIVNRENSSRAYLLWVSKAFVQEQAKTASNSGTAAVNSGTAASNSGTAAANQGTAAGSGTLSSQGTAAGSGTAANPDTAPGAEPAFDFRFRLANGNEDDMETLKEQIRTFLIGRGMDENKIFYSSNYFEMKDFQGTDNSTLYIIGLLVVIACGVVIYSLFYISVAGKMREYGRLKVIGTTPRQLKKIVRREGIALSLRSIPLGIVIAGAAVYALMPAYWQWGKNLPAALGVAVVMFLTVLISTNTPVRMAGKVSAIEAVSATNYTTGVGRIVSKQLHRRITPISLARMSFDRNRKKSVFTFISLGLTGIMLMGVASAASSFSLEGMAVENLGDGGHYMLSISPEEMETEQELLAENLLSDELYETLSSMDAVEKITRFNSSYVFVEFPRNSEGQNLTGLTREQVKELLPQDFMVEGAANYDEMAAKNGVIIGDSEKLLEKFYGFTPKVGDVLHCRGFNGESLNVTVMGVAKGSLKTGVGASFILCVDQTLQKFYPQTTNFSTVWNVHAKKDSDELRQAIFAAADDGRIDIMSRQDYIDLVSDSAANTVKGLYMLVAFLFLFALINLVNTLMTNLISKRQELGVLQSVGMSSSQLSAMLSAECLWYGAVTLLITIFIGGPIGAAVCSALGKLGIFGTMTYHFPWQALLIFTAVLAVIQLCYSASAIRFLKKQSLVERIKAAD